MLIHIIKPPASLVSLAHRLVAEKVKPGATVIDATIGNGHDTLFLLELVKSEGALYGFDIQPEALRLTNVALQQSAHVACVELIEASHTELAHKIPRSQHGKIAAVMFNLGYLPGGDKRIVTQTQSTLSALAQAAELLAADGLLSILAYPGHPGGDGETAQVNYWCRQLDAERFRVNLYQTHQHNPAAPILFTVNKLL